MTLRRSGYVPSIVHLRLRDDSVVPTPHDLGALVESLRGERGVETLRTSALFPLSAQRFASAGFTVVDTLRLLRVDLGGASVRSLISAGRLLRRPRVATMRRRHYEAAAHVDRAAFGLQWGHDAAELDEIRYATPRHRGRCRLESSGWFARDLHAFAVSGASTEHGYLQRLSVEPVHQRRGLGRELTLDALRWMVSQGLPDCLVNTSVENTPALALYDSVGFSPLRDHLSVMQLDLHPS